MKSRFKEYIILLAHHSIPQICVNTEYTKEIHFSYETAMTSNEIVKINFFSKYTIPWFYINSFSRPARLNSLTNERIWSDWTQLSTKNQGTLTSRRVQTFYISSNLLRGRLGCWLIIYCWLPGVISIQASVYLCFLWRGRLPILKK